MCQGGFGTTTLSIRPLAGEVKHYEILSHFSAFGNVSNVRIRKETKHSYGFVNNVQTCSETEQSYGFVEFTMPESAAKVLQIDFHIINGRRVKVAVANGRHQEDSTNMDLGDDKTGLLHLNDDCILEILSQKCLSAIDLCCAAETCRRLKEIASRAFKRHHKECDIHELSAGKRKTAKRILRKFGSEIRHLRIDGKEYSEDWSRKLIPSLSKYCSTSLQSLDLHKFIVPEKFTAMLRPMFNKLQRLAITKCNFNGASKELFANCGSLVQLDIGDYKDTAFMLEKSFPKLQQLEYRRLDSDSLDSFILRHMNLTSLKIWCYLESLSLQLIAGCTQLQTLQCCISANSTLDLSNLCHLRELDVSCARQNVSETALGLENLNFLENLSLSLTKIDSQFVRNLAQLKRLQQLKLEYCSGLQSLNQIDDVSQLTTLKLYFGEHAYMDIVSLVERLSKLNDLSVAVHGFKMDLEMYLRIVDVVRDRPNKSRLTFRLARYNFDYDRLLPDISPYFHLVEVIVAN